MQKKRLITGGIAALAAIGLLSACSNPTDTAAGGTDDGAASGDTIVVSSANFPESEIIGNLYAEALKDAGFTVETQFNIGSREAYIPALSDGSIDLIPDYTGNLLIFLDPEAETTDAETINTNLTAALETEGLTGLTPAEAEDKDAVVVTKETAEKWNLTTIADLAAHNAEITYGAPAEFQERPQGLPGLKANYGVEPAAFTPIADGGGPATVDALVSGQVQVANIFTTSPAIVENDLVVLEDPKNNFPAQQVIPIGNTEKLTPEVAEVIDAISAQLTTDELIALNTRVSGDEKVEPTKAATDWLTEKGLLGA